MSFSGVEQGFFGDGRAFLRILVLLGHTLDTPIHSRSFLDQVLRVFTPPKMFADSRPTLQAEDLGPVWLTAALRAAPDDPGFF